MNQSTILFRHTTASTLWLRVTVVLGIVLADVLFYRQPAGWTCGAFLLFAGLLLVARPAPPARRNAMHLALLVLTVAAGATAYCGGALGVALALLALGGLVAARMDSNVWHADLWAAAGLRALPRIPLAWVRDRRLLYRRRGAARRAAATIPRTLVKWLIPVALTGIFLWLFCLANPVIDRGVARALDALGDFLLWVRLPEFPRLVFWCLMAAGLWGVWRVRAARIRRAAPPTPNVPTTMPVMQAITVLREAEAERRADLPPAPPPAVASAPARPEDDSGLVLRCLGLFNVLFAVETVTDLMYLWGGRALPEGMTYAAYAHRGSYPLVATALLSAALTLCFFRPGRAAEKHAVARALVFAWLAQNLLLTVSAVWRLHLYVDIYTLTQLRVAAFVWMGLVLFGLASLVCRIAQRRENRWLMDINAVALLAVLLACAWWPIRGFVADHNFRYCREAGGPGPSLDLAYLRLLGPEAIPALRDYARLDAARSAEATQIADNLASDLREQLRNPRAWTWRQGALLSAASRQVDSASAATKPR